MMRSDTPPVIYDARPREIRRREPYRTLQVRSRWLDSPDRVDQLYAELEVVVYCVYPNEGTAKTIARQLRAKGFSHVWPLQGGLDAWEKHGYPVEPIPALHLHAPPADHDDIDRDMVTIRATAPE